MNVRVLRALQAVLWRAPKRCRLCGDPTRDCDGKVTIKCVWRPV